MEEKKKYKISVITPLHNVERRIFEETIASMKKQTFGFENIEWIVVLHNCSDEEAAGVHELLDGCPNVRLEPLKNDVHSPSSPRNYGLEKATGEYVGFLDGDDRYTSWCISKVVEYLDKSQADLCHFRRMVELEKEGGIILNELVMWDQTQEMIVVNKDNWDSKRLFVGTWGMCTSKIYRRDFLMKHEIRFDDTISFAEDYDFSLSCYALAGNICLAPQLIGYVYYVNGSSLVQTTKLTSEVVLRYAKGFKKLFDKGLSYGIYMNDSMGMLLLYEAIILNACKDLDPAVRTEIRDMLEPYIRMMEPIADSKIYIGGRAGRMNTLPKKIILGETAVVGNYIYRLDGTPALTILDRQKDALKAVLRLGMNADYGKRYHFPELLTMEDYVEKVPEMGYEEYKPMIDLTINIGEQSIFTEDFITSYAVAHDENGKLMRLPFTQELLNPYVAEFRKLLGKGVVFMMAESLPYRASKLTMDNKYTNTITGLMLTEYVNQNTKSSEAEAKIVTPSELIFPKSLCDFEYVRLVIALGEEDVDTIYAPNAWVLYSEVLTLYKKWEQLCQDVGSGILSETNDIPAQVVEAINEKLRAHPQRAAELRKIFREAKGRPLLTQIWPKLTKVIADGSGSYEIYRRNVAGYLGEVSYSNGFLADECCFYGPAREDVFKLSCDNGFFEFRPLDGEESRPCFAHEVKEGEAYSLVVSNKAGLFRYRTDLQVRAQKIENEELYVRKLCPTAYDLTAMAGIREEDVYEAVLACEEKLGLRFEDFTFLKDKEAGSFLLVLEPEKERDIAGLTALEHASLTALATDYFREKGFGVEKVTVVFCEPEAHLLYRDMQMFKKGVLADGIAPCHISSDETVNTFFELL